MSRFDVKERDRMLTVAAATASAFPDASKCECGADVFWERTEKNHKAIMIDAKPVATGNIVMRDGLAHALRKDEEPAPDETRYVAHFATCPDAARYRKKAST